MTLPTVKDEILLAGFDQEIPENGYQIGAVTYFENHCEVQNGIELEEMQFHLQRWTVFKERANIYVGDLLNSLNEKFGEVAAQIESTLGYTYGTQAKMKSVMKAFPPDKRHDGLKFAHYAKAQAWEDADQMLLKAAEEGLNAEEMANEHADDRKKTPAKKKQETAEVIAAGDGKKSKDGNVIPIPVKVGDLVLMEKYSGQDVTLNDVDYVIIRADDIIAIVEK